MENAGVGGGVVPVGGVLLRVDGSRLLRDRHGPGVWGEHRSEPDSRDHEPPRAPGQPAAVQRRTLSCCRPHSIKTVRTYQLKQEQDLLLLEIVYQF